MTSHPLKNLTSLITMGCLILGVNSFPSETAHSGPPLKYEGLQMPPMTEGHVYRGGYSLPGKGRYGVHLIRYGKKHMMWLTKRLGHDDKGHSIEVIKSVIGPREIPEGHEFYFSTCQLNEQWHPKIVAIVKLEDKEALTQVLSAWRANLAKEKFEPIPTRGVQCIVEGWDHE